MIDNKRRLIEQLTGVNSSKLNYYVELKRRNEEIARQNYCLEIIHDLTKHISIAMSLDNIIERVYRKLPLVINCDFLGLALLEQGKLYMTVGFPHCDCINKAIPEESLLWQAVGEEKSKVYNRIGDGEVRKYVSLNCFAAGSLLVEPLIVKGKIIGLLIFGSRKENAYAEPGQLKFTRQLTDQLAICIENARLYEEVVKGKREWEETFHAVTQPIFLIDLDFNVLRHNSQLNGLPGSTETGEKLAGRKCYRVIWGNKNKCEVCLLEEVVENRKSAYRRMQLSSGRVLDLAYFPVLNEKNQIYAVIHYINDVTEKVKMEAQLVQSAKLAAIGEMAAGVAHEMNSPMTAIIGTAQMMLRDTEPRDSGAELLRDIVLCGLRCKKIIQNLLIFSRQDHHPFSEVNLNEVVEKVLSLAQYQVNRNRIKIEEKLVRDMPMVYGNEQQLQQVLINFLLNARDALESRDGDGWIRIATSVERDQTGKKVALVKVEDNGEGIEPDSLSKIFNPFFTTKEASKGTGLGLSVSLGIAQAHGGTIEVESEPGKGSAFSLVLPAEIEDRSGHMP